MRCIICRKKGGRNQSLQQTTETFSTPSDIYFSSPRGSIQLSRNEGTAGYEGLTGNKLYTHQEDAESLYDEIDEIKDTYDQIDEKEKDESKYLELVYDQEPQSSKTAVANPYEKLTVPAESSV